MSRAVVEQGKGTFRIIHEAISMAEPVIALVDVGKDFEKCLAVLVVLENRFFVIAAVGDVVYRAGVFYAERSGHEGSLAGVWAKVQQYGPDPKMFVNNQPDVVVDAHRPEILIPGLVEFMKTHSGIGWIELQIESTRFNGLLLIAG